MPALELSDDYVAQALTRDAKASSSKYVLHGFGESLPKRPTNNAPKPNTRFLKNIIKETDSHNAALRAKEVRDSQIRFGLLKVEKKERKAIDAPEIQSPDRDSHRSKRRRFDEHAELERRRQRNHRRSDSEDPSRPDRHELNARRRHREGKYERKSHDESQSRVRHHHPRRRQSRSPRRNPNRCLNRSRSRSPHPKGYESRRNHHRARRRDRSASSDSHRYASHKSKRRERGRSPTSARDRKEVNSATLDPPTQSHAPGSESDPLESIIGPPPPPPEPRITTRGRGVASSSGIDSHFSNNYDPAIDTHLDPEVETDDWDQALEALRDRQKWQQQGADRLRAAGFSETEVSKWASKAKGTSTEGDEADVRWRGKGERREWDRGKIVTSEGAIATEAEWGRLT